jgi:hypothetical protein
MRAQSAFPSKNAEHTHQELMRTLSIRIVSYAYAQHKHKNSEFEKVPQSMLSMRVRN